MAATNLVVSDHPYWSVLNNGEPYRPLPWQDQHIHAHPDVARLILACGRRSGKSTGLEAEVVREAFRPPQHVMGKVHHPLIYVVGPNYELSMRIWEPVWNLFVPELGPLHWAYQSHDKQRRLITLVTGARLQGKSADDPKSLQGERVTAAFVDEGQDVNEEAFAYLMPALADSRGRLIMAGIPRGKNRFRSYFERGQSGDPQFYSASVPSTANPAMTPEALQELSADLSDIEFRQQYLAEWVEEDGQIFRHLDDVFTGELEEPGAGPYLMGLDIGKMHDYTVAYVIDVKRGAVVASDRFNGLDYMALGARIAHLYNRYRCRFIHMDATGVGESAQDILRAEGCSILPFKFTNESKARLIGRLASEIEHGRVVLPRSDHVLRRELDLFEGTVAPGTTTLRYSAPPGYFDDCVIALALAVYKSAPNRLMGQAQAKPYVSFRAASGPRGRHNRQSALPGGVAALLERPATDGE